MPKVKFKAKVKNFANPIRPDVLIVDTDSRTVYWEKRKNNLITKDFEYIPFDKITNISGVSKIFHTSIIFHVLSDGQVEAKHFNPKIVADLNALIFPNRFPQKLRSQTAKSPIPKPQPITREVNLEEVRIERTKQSKNLYLLQPKQKISLNRNFKVEVEFQVINCSPGDEPLFGILMMHESHGGSYTSDHIKFCILPNGKIECALVTGGSVITLSKPAKATMNVSKINLKTIRTDNQLSCAINDRIIPFFDPYYQFPSGTWIPLYHIGCEGRIVVTKQIVFN